MSIHKTAIVSPKAEIDPSAEIGPNVIIDGKVTIGAGVKIMANAYISGTTEIGEGTLVHMGAVIGHEPQDLTYKGEETFTKVGKNNIIREYVTIHRGATKEEWITSIGDNNLIMGACHLGHNCRMGSSNILVNSALLAGHVKVGNFVFISGNVVFHQFCRIGDYAMIGGFTGVNKDVPPYMLVRGPSVLRGLNLVGLRRSGISREVIHELKEAYKLLFMSGMSQEAALGAISQAYHSAEIANLTNFIRGSKRGICVYNRYEKDGFFE
ncbi:MAG: acyl-ACP--UDP-N-acetylglucosamine O-acyltransferase [Candidatus Omnitrophica bacterium]|nr:acyl-ACP--UDP-N-acetylglucosamine O-acyltransferase [Candidatus Omnitrophota bacterium]